MKKTEQKAKEESNPKDYLLKLWFHHELPEWANLSKSVTGMYPFPVPSGLDLHITHTCPPNHIKVNQWTQSCDQDLWNLSSIYFNSLD